MADSTPRFVWYELLTHDTDAATAFYTSVVGWQVQVTHMAGPPYTLLLAGATPAGGLAVLPPEAVASGARPGWVGYVAVADVDAAAARLAALGGTIRRPAADIPNVGRFAVAADPQGAGLMLFRPDSAGPGPSLPPGTPGRIAWHELMTTDWPKALDFYTALFGWTAAGSMEMGALGTYQMFAAGGETIGGMFNKPPAVPRACWLYYVQVGDIDAAVQRITQGGGQVVNGPTQVPGGDWIIQGMDPQGAPFALVGKRG